MSQVLNFVKDAQPPNDGKLKNEQGFSQFHSHPRYKATFNSMIYEKEKIQKCWSSTFAPLQKKCKT